MTEHSKAGTPEERMIQTKGARWKRIGSLVLITGVAFFLGYGVRQAATDRPATFPPASPGAIEAEVAGDMIYVCPMMCVPPMERAGRCPVCGMDLVATPAPPAREGEAFQIRLTPEAVGLAEVRTKPVERRLVEAEVRLYGAIDYDPAHVTNLTAFMPGVIDRIYVKRAGQFVRWGEPLFDMYSSDLLETQKELIEAMKYVPSFLAFQAGIPHAAKEVPVQDRLRPEDRDPRSPEVQQAREKIRAIRRKLSILGMPKRDTDELMKRGEATGVATVYSSMYGQVIRQNAFEGAYVNTGTPIFSVGDPRYVWVELEAYESDYPWVRKGQKVLFTTEAYPGETFEGKVVYLDPVFDSTSRTFTVGGISPDRGGRLKAGMLVRARILARLRADGTVADSDEGIEQAPLVIPETAPLVTGKRAVVYVRVPGEEGLFEAREIRLGPRAGDHYVVTTGLEEGEEVVENGAFKIDSEVQIQAGDSLMTLEDGRSALGHHHPGGSDVVHEDYWRERMKSRLSDDAELEALEGKRKGAESRGAPHSVQRRKPGMYGSSTKPFQDSP